MVKNSFKNTDDMTTQAASYAAVGRRKRAIARVRVYLGAGDNTINGKPAADYCHTINQKKKLQTPFTVGGLNEKYHWSAKVVGGGPNGQIDAVVHGIARCAALMSDAMRATMSQNGLLTRDPREKERKKIYHVRARKMPQFSKR